MRLYNRKDFLVLPPGTIYADGKQWYFNDLRIKGQTQNNDFTVLYLNTIEYDDRLEEMLAKGTSYPLDEEGWGRDGMFDEEEIFLVYEKEDLVKLKSFVENAINCTEHLTKLIQ